MFLKSSLAIGTKVLVTPGYEDGSSVQNTELIDLTDPSFQCTVSQFPTSVYAATGGLIGNTPLICGGLNRVTFEYQKSCYSLQEDGDWKLESNLNTKRGFAANGHVIMNNKLLIAGGWNGTRLATIEVVAPNTKSETLPIRLPVAMSGSCIVPWDANTFMIIGGRDSGSDRNDTYFINIANNTYTTGPTLLIARAYSACHNLKINGEDFIIVAGGSRYSDSSPNVSNSTEYLQKANYASGWKKSKN